MAFSFNTYQEAFEYLQSQGDLVKQSGADTFYSKLVDLLDVGEYATPDYKIKKYHDGFGIHRTFYYNAGTMNVPQSGRVHFFDQNLGEIDCF